MGGKRVTVALTDSAGLAGTDVDLPNATWGARYNDGGTVTCAVVGLAAGASDDGSDAYVVKAEDHLYLVRAETVRHAATRTTRRGDVGDSDTPVPQRPPRPAAPATAAQQPRQDAEALRRPAAQTQQPKQTHASRRMRVGGKRVTVKLTDDAGLAGTDVDLPDATWGARYNTGGTVTCAVIGLAAGASDDGSDAYVIEAEGHPYLVRAETVRRAATRAPRRVARGAEAKRPKRA